MKEVAINFTKHGWEVLVDGWPSPRFERYARAVRKLVFWARTAVSVFLIGPAVALAFVSVLYLFTGQLKVSATSIADHRYARLTIDIASGRDAGTMPCEKNRARGSPADRACAHLHTDTGEEARPGLMKLLFIYLLGAWFAVEHLLKKRWPDRFKNL
jgi:hypothetical protein